MNSIFTYSADKSVRKRIATLFAKQTTAVETSNELSDLERHLSSSTAATLIVDIDADSGTAARLLRNASRRQIKPGVIVISSRDELPARLDAYDAGADLFLAKNISDQELAARTSALQRRVSNKTSQPTPAKRTAQAVKLSGNAVYFQEKLIRLSPTELRIFAYLLEQRRRVIGRNELLAVAGLVGAKSRSLLNVHLFNIRHKFAKQGVNDMIRTIPGQGYIFNY